MSSLSKEERAKIVEEERIRAEERAKYAQPQQVVIKQKSQTSGCTMFILGLIIFGVIVSMVLVALGDARDKANKAREQAAASSIPSITEPVFDIPSLLGKDVSKIQEALGEPVSSPAVPKLYEGKDWDRAWEKSNQRLAVSYDLKTSKVIDFFLNTDDPSGATKDKDRLLRVGNLKADDSRYVLEFVPVKDFYNMPGSYTGVKVTPR